jgi:hypothetical protein
MPRISTTQSPLFGEVGSRASECPFDRRRDIQMCLVISCSKVSPANQNDER